jgi:hypothetical protein
VIRRDRVMSPNPTERLLKGSGLQAFSYAPERIRTFDLRSVVKASAGAG